MEGSNNWGYGHKTQHSYPRSRLITWRRPEVKFGRNVVKKKLHKNYQDEDKKSAINKKLILRLRSLVSKWFQLKDISDKVIKSITKAIKNWKLELITLAEVKIQRVIFQEDALPLGLVSRVFTNDPRDCGSIPGRVIPKTLKMVLDTYFLNTQH